VRAATAWAEACHTEQGALRYEPACPAGQAPELIGTVVLLQYLNRMVNVFLGDVPLPPGAPRLALGPVMRLLAGMIKSAAAEPHPPGTSLDLLPAADPLSAGDPRRAADPLLAPGDARWAAASPVIADAFARARAAVDAAGARSVPPAVRDAVMAGLAGWRGEPRGPSRAWADDAVRGLPAGHRAAGRLALLTALASYQVDKSVIASFRRERPDDAALVELTAWASFAAASRAGSWIPVVQHSAAASAGPP
jgi:hypothetical protein